MKPRKATYLIHRWVGLVVCLQLLAWSAGGFIFSVLHIENVRGERDALMSPYESLSQQSIANLPDPLIRAIDPLRDDGHKIANITLCDRGLGPFWEITAVDGLLVARIDPSTASPAPHLSPDEAEQLALRDFIHDAPVASVRLIESDPPTEYRSGPLPAYAVHLDHPKHPHIYVHAETGQITARRNRLWRIFDFFWMLHTMDYTGRDNFNHPLLTAFSILAITTSASGLLLWGWRLKPRRATA